MSTQPEAFTIRWGKLSLAAFGVLSLLAVPVTGIVAALTSLSAWIPVICLVLFAGAVLGLRVAAVRDRRKKAWLAATARLEAEHAAAVEAEARAAQQKREALELERAAEEAAVAQAAAEESLRRAPAEPFDLLASQPVESEVDATPEQTATEESTAPAAQSWAPRTLPTPSYVGAARAEREAPEALDVPEDKKANHLTSIRAAEAAKLAQERTERLDLDKVLSRRRA